MLSRVEKSIAQFADECGQTYSRWNEELFRDYIRGPLKTLESQLLAQGQAADIESVLIAYLQMVCEAIGVGWVERRDQNSTNLLEFCLREAIPRQLAGVSNPHRLQLLARIWNLSEGLAREPAWLNQYVANRAAKFLEIQQIEKFLVESLTPVLSPPRPAAWAAPFRITVLNPRPWEHDFLPGEMCLTAPLVACITDRRGTGCLGVLLQRNGQSEFIGPLPPVQRHSDPQPDGCRIEPNRLRVAGQEIALPFLASPHQTLFTSTGFALVSAVDSQRLWVVESQS